MNRWCGEQLVWPVGTQNLPEIQAKRMSADSIMLRQSTNVLCSASVTEPSFTSEAWIAVSQPTEGISLPGDRLS